MKKPIITLLAATVTLAAAAVPAKRGVLSVTQPDGQKCPFCSWATNSATSI